MIGIYDYQKNFENLQTRMNLGWIIIITNLALTYFMGLVVLKEMFELLKNLIKYLCKFSHQIISRTKNINKVKN